MEAYNQEKISSLSSNQPQLRALVVKHRELDEKIASMIDETHLPVIKGEVDQLKKEKLLLKDQILIYLKEHDEQA